MNHAFHPPSHHAGFSLVELMIAIALGMALVAGVTFTAVNSNSHYRALVQSGQQMQNGSYAMELLKDDLHHAGFFGELHEFPAAAALPEFCDLTIANLLQDLADGMGVPVQGYNNLPATLPSGYDCIDDHGQGADLLVVRRTATYPSDPAQQPNPTADPNPLVLGQVYLQNLGDQYVLGLCTAADTCQGIRNTGSVTGTAPEVFNLGTKHNGTRADIRPYHLHIYYVRTWSQTTGDGMPTLVRLSLSAGTDGNPTFTTEVLAEGIENIQVQYGLDDGIGADGNPAGTAEDGTPDRYLSEQAAGDTTPAAQWWSATAAVRLNLLARQKDRENSTDTKAYDFGEGEPVVLGGNFKRHLLSGVARLVNVGGRREI